MDFQNSDIANKIATYGVNGLRPFLYKKKGSTRATPFILNKKGKLIQANAGTLLPHEWKHFDNAIHDAAEQQLTGFQDLVNRGLTVQVPDALGSMTFDTINRVSELKANVTMDGRPKADNNQAIFIPGTLPLPITHADFQIGARALAASRKNSSDYGTGSHLDTTQLVTAARAVLEAREKMLFADKTFKFGGGTIYSFLNHPDRLGGSGNTLKKWTDNGVKGPDIVDDVNAIMKAALRANGYPGPYVLYVNSATDTKLNNDYTDYSDKTIRQRILEIQGIQDVITVDMLPERTAVLVQTTPDVVRVVQGIPLTTVQWQSGDGFVNNFKVLSIEVPEVRSDGKGQSGVYHGKWAS